MRRGVSARAEARGSGRRAQPQSAAPVSNRAASGHIRPEEPESVPLRLEALSTVDGPALCRLEGDLRVLAAPGAGCRMHLSGTLRPSRVTHSPASSPTGSFSLRPAVGTPLGLVGEAALEVALLILAGVDKLRGTICTHNVLVRIRHLGASLLGWLRRSF